MNDKEQFEKMTTVPVSHLIMRLSGPTILSMMVTAIYNLADTFFVSQLGTSASAAVGIVFSVMAIIQAVGFTLGMGSASLISRRLGERKNKEADIIGSSAFAAALIFGTIVAVIGQIFINQIMRLLGATETILPYARNYARFIFLGAPLMTVQFVMNNELRSEGKAAFSMIALTTGGLLNMLLDPVFIFVLKFGTTGAAVATLISQSVSFCIFIQFYIRKKSIVCYSVKNVSRKIRDYWSVVSNGLPSLCRQGLASIATVLLNRSAAVYSDAAIAGMSITTRIVMLVAGIMIGIGQGFTPVSGYNYGAKKYDRVKKAYLFTVEAGFVVMSMLAFFIIIYAPQIIKLFRDDADVILVGSKALRFQCYALPLHCLIIGTNMLMQSTGNIVPATFLSCNRQGVYFIPAILILPHLFGITGIESAQMVSDILSVLTAIPFVLLFFKKLDRMKKEETDIQ